MNQKDLYDCLAIINFIIFLTTNNYKAIFENICIICTAKKTFLFLYILNPSKVLTIFTQVNSLQNENIINFFLVLFNI